MLDARSNIQTLPTMALKVNGILTSSNTSMRKLKDHRFIDKGHSVILFPEYR